MNKNILKRFRNKGLWLSIFAFIPMLCQGLGLHILPANYVDMVNSILGILVVAGVISNPEEGSWYLGSNDEIVK